MSEPTTCRTCGMPGGDFHMWGDVEHTMAGCVQALGEAVRALQAKLDAPEVRVESGAFAGLVPPPSQKIGGGQADLSGAARGAQTTPIPPDAVEALNRAPEPPATEWVVRVERLLDQYGYRVEDLGLDDGATHAARAALMDAIRARLRAPQGGAPDQPIHTAPDGMVRFVANPIVRDLLDHGSKHGMDMNDIAARDYPRWARVQFAQLIGYSLRGYSELSYVSDADYERAVGAPQGEPDPRRGFVFRQEWGCDPSPQESVWIRVDKGEPDPDLMEAWADWYDEHMDVGVRVGPDAFYHAAVVLRELAADHRRERHVARAHRDATGDTP